VAEISYTVSGGVGRIVLDRPARKNAFTLEMVDAWAGYLAEARADPEVRAVVVTATGDAFCSGGDLDVLNPAGGGAPSAYERKAQLSERIQRVALAMEDLDKPVVAGVNGVAVGAGLDMALMCDIRVAARSARFSTGYVRVGLPPGDGGAYYLPRLVGLGKALELLLTGDFVDAEEALRIGLVNRICEDGEAATEAVRLASRLASLPPLTVRTIKRTVYQSARVDLRTALDLVSSHFGVLYSTADTAEAIDAVRAHRSPTFEGR
jgi:enoyl-CoA hydratase/carnithine racemase